MRLKILILILSPILFFNQNLLAQSIEDFVSVNPNVRDATLRLPETHTFQTIIQEGDLMTGGATFQSNVDFTGYVPIKGSSINGYLSINNESNNGGVTMLDINYDQAAKLWNTTYSEYVDFSAFGRTARNCSGAVTPWATIITSEEVSTTFNDINNDGYLDYGWQVEIDPVTKQVIDKRWALGRFAHENAVIHKNWRTVYQGADEDNGYLYKFVADLPADLSSGKLYVYKGSKTGGSGQWILIPNTTKSQRNNTRSLAQNVGATRFNGIEDVEIGPDGLVYFTVKSENRIFYFKDSDPISGTSVSFLNKYVGNRSYTINTVNGNVSHSWAYGNDNLAFDNEGNLWVLQDGQKSHIWVVRKGHTESNPKVEVFATTPSSCEPTGITFSPDGRFMFLSIQHPAGNAWQTDAAGRNVRFNSDATIVIARKEYLGAECLGSCPDCDDNIQNYEETGQDCGGSCENCPTCFDRIKNGNETGIDCGGNACASCPTVNIAKTDITCRGDNNGTAIAEVIGGAGTITYLWNTGDTTSRIENLNPGNYSVKIADSNGNQSSKSVTISQAGALNITGSFSLPSTQAANNGSISINVSGGQSPYGYKWSNNATSKNIGSLSSNTYTVGVTDANGCNLNKAFNIELAACSNFEVSLYSKNIKCANGADGSAIALVAGGTPPFNYSWSNGSNAKAIENLSAGNYSVTVTDANGCQVSNAVVIDAPANPLNISLSSTNTDAIDANNGSIVAAVSGGASPYQYDWSNGSSASSINNLSKGAYTLKVIDNRGCTAQKAVEVFEYTCPVIAATISTTDITCYGFNDGSANININGGASPYNVRWSDGTTGSTAQNLSQGVHSATVTDAKGCSAYFDFEILEPTPLATQLSTTHTTDALNNDGTASVLAAGGTGSYSYEWSTGTTINSIYNGVWAVGDSTWTTGDTLWLTGDTIWATDNVIGALNDTIWTTGDTIKTIDGSVWSVNDTTWLVGDTLWAAKDTIKTINNSAPTIDCLNNEDYNVIITDQNNCSVTSNFKIQPYACSSLSVQLSKTDLDCFSAANGAITTNVSGTTGPLTYVWSNGATTNSLSNLSAGTYSVLATDNSGCQAFAETEIKQPSKEIFINLSSKNLTSVGANDGQAIATVSGGTPPYVYNWLHGDDMPNAVNLSPGIYTLTVIDANNCIANKSIMVRNLDCSDMSVSLATENTGCSGSAYATIIASIENATTPVSYNWSNNATTPFLNNLSSTGQYSLEATDANGCIASKNININNNSTLQTNDNVNNLNGYNSNNGSISVTVNGGNMPYSYYWGTGSNSNSITNLPAGTYDFLAVDELGCSILETNTINNYNCDFEVLSTIENITCRNGNDGSINIEAMGGAAPYSYNWLDIAQNTNNRNNLTNGTYTVEVIDNKNCKAEVKAKVEQPISQFSISVSKTNETFYKAANGTATATKVGGVEPITYQWSTGLGNATVNNLSAGSYNVKAVDANGCAVNQNFSISGISCSNLSLNVNKTDIDCFDAANGNGAAIVTGGTAPYKISWANGDLGNNSNFLEEANYATHVVDAVGCEANSNFSISQPAELVYTTNKTDITYFGLQNGSASVSVSGGVTPYTYSWSNGNTLNALTNLSAGQYTVDVTDANGCTFTETFEVKGIDCKNIEISSINKKELTCRNSNDGEISIQVAGGNLPLNYTWSNGDTQLQIDNLSSGNYTINVTDNLGCKDVRTIVLNNPPNFNVSLSTSDIAQAGTNTGTATLNITGGVQPYSINWSNGATTATVNNFASGSHSYTVVDKNGCTKSGNFTLCTPPFNLKELSILDNTAVIGWAGDPTDGNYTYRYRNISDGTGWQTGSTTNTFILLNNLPNCKNFEFEVFGTCTSTGTLLKFRTSGCAGCLSVNNLYHINVIDVSAFINWDLVPGAAYTLYYRKVGTSTWSSYYTRITYAILYELDPCSQYEWFVDTNCANGSVFHTNLKDSFTTLCLREDQAGDNKKTDHIEFDVFPNPVNNYAFLIADSPVSLSNKQAIVSLYNLSGELIFTDENMTDLNNYSMDVSNLPNGVYFAEVKIDNSIKQVKFVKE